VADPRKFGRYEVIDALGKGAMGTVYRARDPMLHRTVAIKTVNMDLDRDEVADYEARFYQEARAAGGLNHPNIVTIYDIGKSGHIAYMAMELLEGKELRSVMAQGQALPVSQAIDIAAQAAEGLGYAHDHDVVHRDIKPANLMINREGLVKITDFGIARMRSSEVRTQTGVVLGSPRYMSPEQVVGKRAEPRSDIFSLAVILYEMVTGKAPFTGEDVSAIMFQILNFVPPPPSTVNPDAPEMLDFIIAKALAKSPNDRYASAREMANDLRECRQQVPTRASTNLAVKPAQAIFEPESANELLILTAPHTRHSDADATTVPDAAPALGVSKAFDSLAATSRLMIQSGSGEFSGITTPIPPNLGREGFSRGMAPGWSKRDKVVFLASVAGAAVLGAFIIFA